MHDAPLVTNSAPSAAATRLEDRPFFGRPFLWLCFVLVLLFVPALGYMLELHMSWTEIHPALNAMFNGVSAVFLVSGYVAIRRGRTAFHRSCMVGAFAASSVFLASYLARYALSGTHRYPGDGADKAVYLAILMTHMVLATAVLPLVLRSLWLAFKGRYEAHKRIVRWTWPIWMYVSVTGVLIYLMLYPIASALYR